MNRLYRSLTDRKVAGVCGGIAKYTKIDPTIVRLIAILAIIFAGSGLLIYIVCAIVIPNEPVGNNDIVDTRPQNSGDDPPRSN